MVYQRNVNIVGAEPERLRHTETLLDEWLKCQTHLPENYDRAMVRNFIRASKYNLEMTKRKVESYFVAKKSFPQFFANRNPNSDEITKAFNSVKMVFLPQLTGNGDRVSIFYITAVDPSEFDLVVILKVFLMILDLSITKEDSASGDVVIFDTSNLSSSHLLKLISPLFKNMVSILREAYAIRIRQMHVVNASSLTEKLLGAVRPFLHNKVKDRFIIHKNQESLLDQLDAKVLPKDYGGSLPHLEEHVDNWRKTLTDNADWFREQEGVALIGTPPKRCDFSNQISLEGSFRQLNID